MGAVDAREDGGCWGQWAGSSRPSVTPKEPLSQKGQAEGSAGSPGPDGSLMTAESTRRSRWRSGLRDETLAASCQRGRLSAPGGLDGGARPGEWSSRLRAAARRGGLLCASALARGPHTGISLSAQKSVHLQSRTSRRGDGQDLGRPHPSRLTWRSASGHLGDVLPPIWDSRVFSYNAIPGCVFFEEAKGSGVLSGYAY